MKRKNKGFTIIELLAVIIILAVIAVIAVPAVTYFNKKSETSYYEKQEDLINLAGKDYFITNRDKLPKDIGGKARVSLETLINEGYIEPVVDVNNKTCNLKESYVEVVKLSEGRYSYNAFLICDTYDSNDNYKYSNWQKEYPKGKPGIESQMRYNYTFASTLETEEIPYTDKTIDEVWNDWKSSNEKDKALEYIDYNITTKTAYSYVDKLWKWYKLIPSKEPSVTPPDGYTERGEAKGETDFSDWQDEEVEELEGRTIETRTMYRKRDKGGSYECNCKTEWSSCSEDATYSCSGIGGSLSGTKCYITASAGYSCSSGVLSGSNCIVSTSFVYNCTGIGGTLSGSDCVFTTTASPSPIYGNCKSETIKYPCIQQSCNPSNGKDRQNCVLLSPGSMEWQCSICVQTGTSYSCPSGYTLNGKTCTKKVDAKKGCPSGYSEIDGWCKKTVAATKTCPGNDYTISGTTCYKYVSANKTCPSGYTLNGTTCTKEQCTSKEVCETCSDAFGDWSDWTTTIYEETETTQVETKTQYRYKDTMYIWNKKEYNDNYSSEEIPGYPIKDEDDQKLSDAIVVVEKPEEKPYRVITEVTTNTVKYRYDDYSKKVLISATNDLNTLYNSIKTTTGIVVTSLDDIKNNSNLKLYEEIWYRYRIQKK